MKRIDIANLYKSIVQMKSRNYNKFLLLSITKTKNSAKQIIEDVVDKERSLQYNTNITEYEKLRKDILSQYANKNNDETPKIVDGLYDIPTHLLNEVNDKISELSEKFSEQIQKFNKQAEEFQSYMEEDVEFTISKTLFDNIPTDLTPEEFEFLSIFVKEE